MQSFDSPLRKKKAKKIKKKKKRERRKKKPGVGRRGREKKGNRCGGACYPPSPSTNSWEGRGTVQIRKIGTHTRGISCNFCRLPGRWNLKLDGHFRGFFSRYIQTKERGTYITITPTGIKYYEITTILRTLLFYITS